MRGPTTAFGSIETIRVLFLFFLIITFFGCQEKKITYLRGDFRKIFAKAKQENKLVFALLTDSSCSRCAGFEDFLNTQEDARLKLNRDYVCYKVDVRDRVERKFAELLKNPSYPFPYFFDSDGNLLALGFPESKKFDISKLSNIKISEQVFAELFRMGIGTVNFKKLISMNVNAELLFSSRNKADSVKALTLLQNSIEVAEYPYNIGKINNLAAVPGSGIIAVKSLETYEPSIPDRFLYGDLDKYMQMKTGNKGAVHMSAFKFSDKGTHMGNLVKGVKYAFTFQVENLSSAALTITEVSHPCDCIQFERKKYVLKENGKATINGVFIPYQSGKFKKDIYVHTDAKHGSMKSYSIYGTVN